MLIDESYFINHLKISNIDEPDPNNILRNNLLALIEKCEEEVLSLCMGVKMWLDFKEQYQKDPSKLPQNYKNLLYGKTYTRGQGNDEKTFYWSGLVDESSRKSLLAYYAYIVYQKENVHQTTAFGQTKIEGKVGQQVSLTPKITRVYNEFVRMLQGGLYHNHSGLTMEGNPFWVVNGGLDYYGQNKGNEYVSFLKFLKDNEGDFPLLEINCRYHLGIKNEFGV